MDDPSRTQLLGAPPSSDANKTLMGVSPTVNATQIIKPVQCPVCKTFNPSGMMFCIECGLIFDRALDGDAFGAPAVQLPTLVEASGREHPVRPGENVIGREGDILLADGRASRRHAQVTSTDGELVVEDLGSTNGTKLNDAPLEPGRKAPLKPGDAISVGGIVLKLSLPGATSATQMALGGKTAAMAAAPVASVAPAHLVGAGFDFPLKPGINSFGRKSENDVAIGDPYVSGRHGLIELADEGMFVTDVGSTNGTLLNEAKLTPNMRTKLDVDDVIRLGSMEFRIVPSGAAEQS